MANQVSAEVYQQRREKIGTYVDRKGSCLEENDYEIPEQPSRYLTVQFDHMQFDHDEIIWASDHDTLEDAVSAIDNDDYLWMICDLDTGEEFRVIREVVRLRGSKGTTWSSPNYDTQRGQR